MLDTPQAGFKPLKSLKKPLSKSDLVGEEPTGFSVFIRSTFDLVGASVVGLWRSSQHGPPIPLILLIRPDFPDSTHIQRVKYAVYFVFAVS